ncbi:MAG: helix-turn-helix transcriptional regulator [Nitriliruptorales bacterium]|nr:helix-turn-helix transcriptional regulator [Nitriliruptorales bacterium]
MDETTFGELLRTWRDRRRLTQEDLSHVSGVSTRHLSFLETGRSNPSREMVLELAEHLEIPLRERNQLLTAAGFAPVYSRTPLEAPEMEVVRSAIGQVLAGHEPYPAVAVDRYWNIVDMNRAAAVFAADVDPELMGPPPNVYRISLHPDGLAPRVVNFPELAHHLLHRLRHDVEVSADPDLAELLAEIESYPTVRELPRRPPVEQHAIVVPVRLRTPRGELSMFSTISTFGTPVDVTVAELALETFFPADAETAAKLSAMSEADSSAA